MSVCFNDIRTSAGQPRPVPLRSYDMKRRSRSISSGTSDGHRSSGAGRVRRRAAPPSPGGPVRPIPRLHLYRRPVGRLPIVQVPVVERHLAPAESGLLVWRFMGRRSSAIAFLSTPEKQGRHRLLPATDCGQVLPSSSNPALRSGARHPVCLTEVNFVPAWRVAVDVKTSSVVSTKDFVRYSKDRFQSMEHGQWRSGGQFQTNHSPSSKSKVPVDAATATSAVPCRQGSSHPSRGSIQRLYPKVTLYTPSFRLGRETAARIAHPFRITTS